MGFLQMKQWAQNLGAYLFTGTPDTAWSHRGEQALAWSLPQLPASRGSQQPAAPAVAAAPQLTILDGYVCATLVDSKPRRLAWLLKLQLAIDLEVERPCIVPMEQTHVQLQTLSQAAVVRLPSIYLQPPRKQYIPNATVRLQSLSPLIDGTDKELIIHGAGEFFLHASGGSPYFVSAPDSPIVATVVLPLATPQPQTLTITFTPSPEVTAEVHLWVLA